MVEDNFCKQYNVMLILIAILMEGWVLLLVALLIGELL